MKWEEVELLENVQKGSHISTSPNLTKGDQLRISEQPKDKFIEILLSLLIQDIFSGEKITYRHCRPHLSVLQ